jgi:hypothetical protein
MTTPPDLPVPGQLPIGADARAEWLARAEQIEAERDRLADALRRHTMTTVEKVADAYRRHEATGVELTSAVKLARAAGASWETIGAAVGLSRQAAHSRWADQ